MFYYIYYTNTYTSLINYVMTVLYPNVAINFSMLCGPPTRGYIMLKAFLLSNGVHRLSGFEVTHGRSTKLKVGKKYSHVIGNAVLKSKVNGQCH